MSLSSGSDNNHNKDNDDDVVNVEQDEENGIGDKENGNNDYKGPAKYKRLGLNNVWRNRKSLTMFGLLRPPKNAKKNHTTYLSFSFDVNAATAQKSK